MDNEEKQWIDSALERACRAEEKGVFILMVRRQDANDEADIVITNAKTPEMVMALMPLGESDE